MRTEAGKMPESLIFLTENSPGVSNDRFGLIHQKQNSHFYQVATRHRATARRGSVLRYVTKPRMARNEVDTNKNANF